MECTKCRDWGKYERHEDHAPGTWTVEREGTVVHVTFTGDEFDPDAPGLIIGTYEAE